MVRRRARPPERDSPSSPTSGWRTWPAADAAHAHRRHRRDARVHGARAGRGRARDAGQRRLLARPDPLRGVDGHEPGPRPAARPPPRARLGRPLPVARPHAPRPAAELCDAIDDALDVDPAVRPTPAQLRAELAASEGELTDEGGLVEPETLRRVGPRRPPSGAACCADPCRRPAGALRASRCDAPPRSRARRRRARRRRPRARVPLSLGPDPTFSAPAAAGLAALAVALLPRLGWLFAASALCGWLVSPEADRQGTALVVAAAAVADTASCFRAPACSGRVPVLAPLLGTIGAGARRSSASPRSPPRPRAAPGLARGRLPVARRRRGHHRQERSCSASPTARCRARDWEGSITAAASRRARPAPVLARRSPPPLVWAAFAVLLPLVVRGRWLAVDLLGAGLWAAALIAATRRWATRSPPTTALDQARGAVAGASPPGWWSSPCPSMGTPAEALAAAAYHHGLGLP